MLHCPDCPAAQRITEQRKYARPGHRLGLPKKLRWHARMRGNMPADGICRERVQGCVDSAPSGSQSGRYILCIRQCGRSSRRKTTPGIYDVRTTHAGWGSTPQPHPSSEFSFEAYGLRHLVSPPNHRNLLQRATREQMALAASGTYASKAHQREECRAGALCYGPATLRPWPGRARPQCCRAEESGGCA